MAGSTISSTISTEVTLDTGIFLSPLTITNKGAINAPAPTSSFQKASAIYVGSGVTGASVVNHGLVNGKLPAVDSLSVPAILAESPLYLNNDSTIVGQSGIYLNAGGTITNAGLIAGSDARSAHDYGIRLFDGSLINSGTVYGAKYGVTNWNVSGIDNSGTISGSVAGVNLISTTLAYTGTLVNSGTIYSQHAGVTASQALITNTGKITGETYGIHIAWGSTISNSGTITGGFDGVMLLNQLYQTAENSTLLNSGSIAGGYFGVAINFSAVTNVGSGTITGQTFGVGVGEGGYFFNNGSVYGANVGLLPENGGLAVNSGKIRGGTIGAFLFPNGNLTNASSGYIHGGNTGLRDQSGYVLNAGTVVGTSYGLDLQAGGIAVTSGKITSQGEGIYLSSVSVTSSPDFLINSGTVYGKSAGVLVNTGTLYNLGKISGGPIGVSLVSGASLSNSGSIYGQKYGVQLVGGTAVNTGTIAGKLNGVELSHAYLFNSGTISGGTYAVTGQGFTLAVGAGEVFSGKIVDKSDTSTLDLGGAAFGTLAGIGTTITGFDDINFVPGAHWLLSGDLAGLAKQQVINGIGFGDTIVVTDFSATSYIYLTGGRFDLINGTITHVLDITGTFSSGQFVVTESAAGTTIALPTPCFAADTRILTSQGEIAVQDLVAGDTVITFAAEDWPIIWVGKRTIDLQRHPDRQAVQPICIAANALAENVPIRDLWVSPDHALYIDGYLIPAKELLNDSSIYQDCRGTVTYYHIELARHAIIFAENTAAETYLESGNRAGFENGGQAIILHPDFGNIIRRQDSCAALLEAGDLLDAIRARIRQRSAQVAVCNYA